MKGQSNHAKTILEQYDGRNKTFLAFKDGPENPLGRSPVVFLITALPPPLKLSRRNERSSDIRSAHLVRVRNEMMSEMMLAQIPMSRMCTPPPSPPPPPPRPSK